MDRRPVGLVVVLAVLVGGLVAARLLGPETTGTAVAQPPPGPPSIGDCLLSRDAVPFWFVDSPGTEPAPTARIEPCTGDRFGEVVEILQTRTRSADPDLAPDCQTSAESYLGLPTDQVLGDLTWTVASLHLILASGPDARQRAAGQQWIACVVSPGWQTIEPTVADEQAAVGGSLRSAYQDPTLRDRLSYCVSGPSTVGMQIPCGQPHDTQSFGFTVLTEEVERTDVEQSCLDWIARLSGLTDPTDGGSLRVGTTAYDYSTGDPITADRLEPDTSVDCTVGVVDDRRLAGSLLGLGGGPIPWD